MLRKRRKRKSQRQRQQKLHLLFMLLVGFTGWFVTQTFEGAAIAIGILIAIYLLYKIWRSITATKRMLQSGIRDVDQMTGQQFEEYLGALFSSLGYSVKITPASGDYGADLILKKAQDVIVVQAKRYRQSVGVKAVQEVIPAMNMYKANMAWVITNSVYTRQALTLAKHNQVRMIDRKELIKMIITAKNIL